MGVDVEHNEEDGSNEKISSSAVVTGSNTSSTLAKMKNIPIKGHDNPYQSTTEAVASSTSGIGDDFRSSKEEPAQKRIKLQKPTTTITSASSDATAAASLGDDGMGSPSNIAVKAPDATTATVTSSPIELASSLVISKPLPSASGCCDNAPSCSTTFADRSATVKPQHSGHSMNIHNQQQQAQNAPSILPNSSCKTKSVKVSRGEPTNVASSSNNNQGGSSSVITASIESSPQHNSQSSSTSADSSNVSLHDSETNPCRTPSAAHKTSTSGLLNADRCVAQPTISGTKIPAAPPFSRKPIAVIQKSENKTTEEPPGTKTIVHSSKPVPGRTQLVPSAATSTTTVPVSNKSINFVSTSNEAPLKSLNFGHLSIKYLGELEYMLREFRKLERQLLGAKGAQQLEESVGSRERREKLHSFILHLEDTIRQIEMGCKLESEGHFAKEGERNVAVDTSIINSKNGGGGTSSTHPSSVNNSAPCTTTSTTEIAAEEAKKQLAHESALSHLTKEKEEEETVQKLEEHILANLLPVKVRLKKQLAAQQGATQNPPGMPAMRRGVLQPSSTTRGKGTFVEAVEKKRKHAESLRLAAQVQHERQVRSVSDPTQFGKPLSGVGSSLTKKLHGSTLGSKSRRSGHGVGSSKITKDTQERKILHAGMVPKSTQQESGLSAASGAHEIRMTTSQSIKASNIPAPSAARIGEKSIPAQNSEVNTKMTVIAGKPKEAAISKMDVNKSKLASTHVCDTPNRDKSIATSSSVPLSEEDKLKFKKHRRLRKLKRLRRRRERELARQQYSKSQQLSNNTQIASIPAGGRKKAGHGKICQKKKGPRVVEYICSQCSEAYNSTCDLNPWWALAQHKCPKCQKTQIPRIDITSPANIIEYHPALLSHLEDGGRGSAGSIPANTVQTVAPSMPMVSQIPDGVNSVNSESDSDLSELSDDNISIGSLKAAELESELQSMSPAERAEHETYGKEYQGPVLSEEHASKLLILMGHASTCPGHHKLEKHKDICRSTKYMMLHVRDCPGTTSTFDVCPFPWCRKVKHLLYHLVSCSNPDQCAICSPKDLPKGLKGLVGLNTFRMKKYRERLLSFAKASKVTKGGKTNQSTKKQVTTRKAPPSNQANSTRKPVPESKTSVSKRSSSIVRPTSDKAPLKPKAEIDAEQSPYTPSTTISTSKNVVAGNSNQLLLQDPMVTLPHPVIAHLSTHTSASNELDFDINAEIAKLDEQLVSDAQESDQTCMIIPIKKEPETTAKVLITNSQLKAEANTVACPPTNYTTISASETTNDHILPNPMAADDADAAELSDLLASNNAAEDHLMPEGDVVDVSEYLKNEYHIRSQHTDDAVRMTEHQQQIHADSGAPDVDALNDPNSDPLANINHEIFLESSDVPHSALVQVPTPLNTCVELKQEYSETMSAPSVQPSHDVNTVTAATTDVENAIGSVKVQ